MVEDCVIEDCVIEDFAIEDFAIGVRAASNTTPRCKRLEHDNNYPATHEP
jgi:hypothetical protein